MKTTCIICLLTLILPTPKVINLCHQYRARPVCTSMQSDLAPHCWLTNLKVSHLDIPKNDNRQFQKCELDYSI